MSLLLVGAGAMGLAYAQALQALSVEFEVLGRGEASARAFEEKSGLAVRRGGVESYLAAGGPAPEAAIVCVNVDRLGAAAMALLRAGTRRLLLEKPGGLTLAEIAALRETARECGAEVRLGYNRRFYASVRAAREMLAEDGGPVSFLFEFTEWGHEIQALALPECVLCNWLLANSSHVIDMAFFLGGAPATMDCRVAGALSWHPSGAVFCGSGVSQTGALFAYHANWAGPGRWGLEVVSRKRRYIFRPLEQLHVQRLGSVAIERVDLDDADDARFKPGLLRQTRAFLEGDAADLPTVDEQLNLAGWCEHIGAGRRLNPAASAADTGGGA